MGFGSRRPKMVWRVHELLVAIVMFFAAGMVSDLGGPVWLLLVAAALMTVLFIDSIRRGAAQVAAALRCRTPVLPSGAEELVSAFGFSFVAMAWIVPWSWFSFGFPLSLTWMLVALLIVGLGLWSRIKALRWYGLILTIVSVLKLALVDIGSVDTVTRVVAFLGGAVVCFGISALYTFAAKHFDKNLDLGSVGPSPAADLNLRDKIATGLPTFDPPQQLSESESGPAPSRPPEQ